MTDAAIKAEVKPEIKHDGAENGTPALAEVEEFEDDVDLWIPPKENEGQAWLVKVSEEMWKSWNDIYQTYQKANDDQPIEIGKMRVYAAKEGEDPMKQRIQIRLAHGVPQHAKLPKEYNLELKSNGYNNTVVFSEKDLPGHRPGTFGRHVGSKPSGIQSKYERYGNRKPGTYRTAIPKQTALAPPIHHEAVAIPVPSASADDMWARQYQAAMEPKTKVTFLHEITRTVLNTDFTFGSITSKPGKSNKKKTPKEKAVRMDKRALLDAITQCFREYTYWSLKALRNRLKQPEAYIKEALDEVAVLVRSGDFAMNYKLNPEWSQYQNVQATMQLKEETAPIKSDAESDGDDGTGDELGEGDDDDDGADFEDVKMED